MVKKILNVIFWVLIVALMAVWVFDFIQVKGEKAPKFCIKNVVHTHDDGEVKECIGLGYKVYNYNRVSMSKGMQFSPFFVKMREK